MPADHDPSRRSNVPTAFRAAYPHVVESCGGERLLDLWWNEISARDPLDGDFVRNYSGRDRFLQNRLILPEEIPFLCLPILRRLLRGGYQAALFLERGAYPFMEAMGTLAELLRVAVVPSRAIRIKGLTRESLACNLLTVACADPRDAERLDEALSQTERRMLRQGLRDLGNGHVLGTDVDRVLRGTREEIIGAVAEVGVDTHVLLPNVLKPVVFAAGNRMLDGPVSAVELREAVDPALYELSPGSRAEVDSMIRAASRAAGNVDIEVLLDWMNRRVAGLRGKLTHEARPLLNVLLRDFRAARELFAEQKTLVVDEISVCGSTALALELVGRAFRPSFCFDFASVVGMWARDSFLDVASASLFELQPDEDLPHLSPHTFAPIEGGEYEEIRPHRFPSCHAVARRLRRWRSATFRALAEQLGSLSAADERMLAQREAELVVSVSQKLSWDSLPTLHQRHTHSCEVLPALISFYLGSFDVDQSRTVFLRRPLLEARLERVLGFTGHLQKPFYRDMGRFFSWLHAWEWSDPTSFERVRAAHRETEELVDRRVAREVVQARDRYVARMEVGFEAIAANRPLVDGYLHGGPDVSETIDSQLPHVLDQLRRAVK